jgi:hydrogenase maturation protein HypF
MSIERRTIKVMGTVQGVGFRPFVFGLATRLGLAGFVSNRGGSVRIEVEGEPARIEEFLLDLSAKAPPLARIDRITSELGTVRGEAEFAIADSSPDANAAIVVSPDVATCDACLEELFDPGDRRYRYPFLNCTNCGPRLTIITGAPYDRARTTMAGFAMCDACRAEYENPADRRFHAQPIACPVCGPRLAAADAAAKPVEVADPLRWFVDRLRQGGIGAMKGLGGYHLVCDARNANAVAEHRRRKHREEKPFAVMVADVAAAEALCEMSAAERELLVSNRRPIVLLERRANENLAGIAPGNRQLGVMLPYTPLHHLLMRDFGGILVMTSGNQSDEPIATGEPEVFERLGGEAGIADFFLTHNRPIHVRCDDSVTRIVSGSESPIRRSRGYAPQPIRLPMDCPAEILAVGGQLKGTFALGREGTSASSVESQAVVSHHLGDLDQFAAFTAFERDIALYERLFAIRPQWIAHDLHPDYASTRYAKKRAAAEGIDLVAVQHHHAHMASCMAEHGLDEPVIGVSFDGTGYGMDGAVWGGEFFVGDFGSFWRVAHLRYVTMPGGDKAIREPWRMAMSHLIDAGVECPTLSARIAPESRRAIGQMIAKKFNSPMTSSAGRLFDAVAAMVGVRDRVSFEGQAAMELQWAAEEGEKSEKSEKGVKGEGRYTWGDGLSGWAKPTAQPWAWGRQPHPPAVEIDTRPLIAAVAQDVADGIPTANIARRFHLSLAEMIVHTCDWIRGVTGISTVVCSGGVFMNSLLQTEVEERLKKARFCPFRQKLVPPNDGGVSLGQLAIAARRIGDAECV